MGFLQNDTSDVMVDAVLTDTGRNFLARNDGSFNITKFALADDEVDYTLISKFGRTLGKYKIETNTPVLEAITNPAFGLKYKLISVSNPNLLRLPRLRLQGDGVDTTGRIISIGNTTLKRRSITVYQDIQDESSINVELQDQSFIVELDNKFIELLQATPDHVDRLQKATYLLNRDAGQTPLGGSKVTLEIATKAILDSQFQVYGSRNNKSLISTFIKITGVQSGAVFEFEAQINKVA
jgi:hypothetical protein